MRTALLLGATGLVGGHLLHALAQHPSWDRVVTLGRRPMEPAGPRHTHRVVDFGAPDAEAYRADDVFCALGTTIRQAGSQEAFRRVDYTYVLDAARLAHERGASQFLVVSSLGADPRSRVFYSRTKGEMERDLAGVGFEALQVFRPSLLTGDRAEPRPGEAIGEVLLSLARPLLLGPLRKYRATPAQAVARAMVHVGSGHPAGVHVYDGDEIVVLGR